MSSVETAKGSRSRLEVGISFGGAVLLPFPDDLIGEMRQSHHFIGHFEKDSLVGLFGFVPWDMSDNPISVSLGKIKTPFQKIMWCDDARKAIVFVYKDVFAFSSLVYRVKWTSQPISDGF